MNGSAVGTQVTPTVMRTGTLGFVGGNWSVNDSAVAFKVGPGQFNLPAPVQVGGTVYPVDYPTQSLAHDMFHTFNTMQANLPDNNFSALTVAGYITFGILDELGSQLIRPGENQPLERCACGIPVEKWKRPGVRW